MKLFLFVILLFISTVSFADGIPIDSNGNITVPHILIDLDSKQISFLNNHRYLKLNEKQKKSISRYWNIDEIEVLDPYHHDCTCGRIYAIWVSKNQIAILKDKVFEENLNEDEKFFIKEIKENIGFYKNYQDNIFYIGLDGKLYHRDNSVSIDILKNAISNNSLYFIHIYLPPKKGNSNWNNIKLLKSKISKFIPEKSRVFWM